LGLATPAVANTYTATRSDDPTPGTCTPSNCSLREAVYAAIANPGPDTVKLKPGTTYTLTIPAGGTDASLDISAGGKLTIEGHGATIDGNGAVTGNRVFDVRGKHSLVLKGLTVKGGVAPSGENGGGIEVRAGATLKMSGGALRGNSVSSQGPGGGGIYNAGGSVTLRRVTVQGNDATFNGGGGVGGGIFTASDGTTTLYDSRFFDNQADGGGALGSFNSPAQVTVIRSQLSYNTAIEDGGAVYDGLSEAHYDFIDTTINNNTGGQFGGAIRVRDAFVTARNSTITRNTGNGGGIAAEDDGGGPTSYVTLADTILAANTDSHTTDGTTPDCFDQTGSLFHSSGYNIVGDTTGCVGDLAIHPATGDQLGTSLSPIHPMLKTENFNGGNFVGVETFALKAGSPAVNAGDPATSGGCASTDARGVPRSLGGRCDIGAYELVKCGSTVVNRVAAPQAGKAELKPTSGNDGILGLGGNDRLTGGAGNDALCGSGGNDVLDGGSGNDRLIGGPGHDVCNGGPGNDTAVGCESKSGIP
jgi:hypothetical protein